MSDKEIIKKAQENCGQYATGYKGDVNAENLREILSMLWNRAKNLTYTFCEWRMEVNKVIGARKFLYFYTDILEYQQEKMEAARYFCHHGQRYCA